MREKKKRASYGFTFSKELMPQVDVMAKFLGMSRSEFVRSSVIERLRLEQQRKKAIENES